VIAMRENDDAGDDDEGDFWAVLAMQMVAFLLFVAAISPVSAFAVDEVKRAFDHIRGLFQPTGRLSKNYTRVRVFIASWWYSKGHVYIVLMEIRLPDETGEPPQMVRYEETNKPPPKKDDGPT
jgi:hypothetical protein